MNLDNENIPDELRLFRKNHYSKNNSIISKIFYLEQSNILKCLACQANKLSFNINNYIEFPLEKVRQYLTKEKVGNFLYVTLENCFEYNEREKKLFGDNQIFCESCKRNSDALSYDRLYNCPEVLTIILNRGEGLEFDVQFKFPMHINLEKYVKDKNCHTNYELIGLIVHLGENEMTAHFIAYCKSPMDNNWYCYNDTKVDKCKDPENEINSHGTPYALFYQTFKEEVPEDSINNESEIFVLYFTYYEKEGYIELHEDMIFENAINKIYEKYNWLPKTGVGFYLQRDDEMIELDQSKTILQNGLKYGEKIIILN